MFVVADYPSIKYAPDSEEAGWKRADIRGKGCSVVLEQKGLQSARTRRLRRVVANTSESLGAKRNGRNSKKGVFDEFTFAQGNGIYREVVKVLLAI